MPTDVSALIARTIATDIGARPDQVAAAVALLDGGATVPFVARYRKEATAGSTTLSCSTSRTDSDTCASSRRGGRR